ncbi:MAG: hypothetical protein NZ516_11255 [Raineya sp.]|nr:hypothetical protein [Raineya sp.]
MLLLKLCFTIEITAIIHSKPLPGIGYEYTYPCNRLFASAIKNFAFDSLSIRKCVEK